MPYKRATKCLYEFNHQLLESIIKEPSYGSEKSVSLLSTVSLLNGGKVKLLPGKIIINVIKTNKVVRLNLALHSYTERSIVPCTGGDQSFQHCAVTVDSDFELSIHLSTEDEKLFVPTLESFSIDVFYNPNLTFDNDSKFSEVSQELVNEYFILRHDSENDIFSFYHGPTENPKRYFKMGTYKIVITYKEMRKGIRPNIVFYFHYFYFCTHIFGRTKFPAPYF